MSGDPAWARRAVGQGVRSCPRAGCREIRKSGSIRRSAPARQRIFAAGAGAVGKSGANPDGKSQGDAGQVARKTGVSRSIMGRVARARYREADTGRMPRTIESRQWARTEMSYLPAQNSNSANDPELGRCCPGARQEGRRGPAGLAGAGTSD
jgi:hypothetical protein